MYPVTELRWHLVLIIPDSSHPKIESRIMYVFKDTLRIQDRRLLSASGKLSTVKAGGGKNHSYAIVSRNIESTGCAHKQF